MSETTTTTTVATAPSADAFPRRRDVHRAATAPVEVLIRPIQYEALAHVAGQRGAVPAPRTDLFVRRAREIVPSPYTVWVWVLAGSPAIYAVTDFLFALLQPSRYTGPLPLVIFGICATISLMSALLDGAELRSRGYAAPSAYWLLLTPLAFLIARTMNTAERRRPAWLPILVWSGSLVLPVLLGLVTAWIFVTTH